MGVITTAPLICGTLIGPIPTTLTLTDPAYLIGHMTCDNRPDVHTVKLDINEYSDGSRAGEWLPYVQAARDGVEQNLQAILSSSGQLHYRALRHVNAGEELLVWYHEEMAKGLNVPEIKNYYVKDGCLYSCPMCGMNFRFPYSLRAHMRFRCENRLPPRQEKSDSSNKTISRSYSEYTKDEITKVKSIYNPYHHVMKCNLSPQSDATRGLVPSPTSSISPGTTSNGSCSPVATGHPVKHSGNSPEGKIPYSESDSSSNDTPFSAPLNLKRSIHRRISTEDETIKRQKTDQNQNIPEGSPNSDDEGISAFRKVSKNIQSVKEDKKKANYQIGTTATTTLLSSSAPLLGKSSVTSDKIMTSQHHQQMISKFRPMLPPGGMPAAYLPGFRGTEGTTENMSMNLSNIYNRALKMEHISTNTTPSVSEGYPLQPGEHELLMNMRHIVTPTITSTTPLPPPPGLVNIPPGQFRNPLQFYRSPNPVVDKLLTSATSTVRTPTTAFSSLVPNNLMQNWCAKCNATFRMTSDLVYHMRSHHKSNSGRTTTKREDKLKCSICSETFKERHHLTRHMSSHV